MPPTNKPININPNGMIKDQDCRVRASKSGGDTISFKANGNGGPWTIDFADAASPLFNPGPPYVVPAGPNGTLTLTPVGSSAKHTYQVKNAAGQVVDDPDVIIEN